MAHVVSLSMRLPLFIIMINLASCGGGFHAVEPSGSDEDLVFRFNTDTNRFISPINIIPKELPSLDPGSITFETFDENQRSPRIRAINPAPNSQIVNPLADGDVSLANNQQNPYNKVGKIIMTSPSDPPGWGSSCTAQLVGNEGVLMTAAHCLYDKEKREWINSLRFNLQYDQGSYTQQYDWECAAMVSGWTNGKYAHDYAFIKLRGVPPGGLGMTINVNGGRVDAVGYPSNFYNGERLVHVLGVRDTRNPSGMNSRMGGGSSGGARILEDGGYTDIVSVNSFVFTNNPNYQYGPVLTSAAMKAYDFARRGCKDRVVPAGSAVTRSRDTTSQNNYLTVLERLDVSFSFGSEIQVNDFSDCSCGEKRTGLTLINTSSVRRLAGVQSIVTTAGQLESNVRTDYSILDPNESVFLGCSRSSGVTGQMCDVDSQYRIISDRRVRESQITQPAIISGSTMAQTLASTDISQCLAACSSEGTNEFCLNLGASSIPPLASVAKFVDAVAGNSSSPDGAIVEKDDIITEFGGDPLTDKDVCERSDINKIGPKVTNEGFGCIISTKGIAENLGLKLRLNMRASIQGEPTTWTPSLTSLTAHPTTLFSDREFSSSIDFEEDAIFTEIYGGDINAASVINENEIVIATSNGCITGYYKNPEQQSNE